MNDAQPNPESLDAQSILNAALDLAQQQGNWYDLSLVDIAVHCDTSISEIYKHFADTNAIADFWFSQALETMLSADRYEIISLSFAARLDHIIWRWFEALAPYHAVTSQMLKAKLHPPHMHHWIPMIFDLSRLVQLWLDMAELNAGGRRRQIQEIALTGIFLVTLSAWCRDQSPQQAQAHSKLLRMLEKAERFGQF
ncbi:TetR/AcrR family transcriptional regulator [Neptuniibacter sp. QD48_55]|uniref:TetR/AcrR family transcriptional regulator n=1 Tax=Neptuniibacter sp. QD48_55 TaxID=3398212 RepID=UPI0039F5D981